SATDAFEDAFASDWVDVADLDAVEGDAEDVAIDETEGDPPADDGGPADMPADDTGAEDLPAEEEVAPSLPTLVISEVDYDQEGGDDLEFLEIYNHGTADVSCSGLRVWLVNGAPVPPLTYADAALSCTSIPPGGFHVIGDSELLASVSCPSEQLLDYGRIENGPHDAIALVTGSGVIIDQLDYDGDLPGWGGRRPRPGRPAHSRAPVHSAQPAGQRHGRQCNGFFGHAADTLRRALKECLIIKEGLLQEPPAPLAWRYIRKKTGSFNVRHPESSEGINTRLSSRRQRSERCRGINELEFSDPSALSGTSPRDDKQV
ncbi:MAG: lamin tail domain-containing protein, partial [Pseudomonadota bacterium]